MQLSQEPQITVGLLTGVSSVTIRLSTDFRGARGVTLPAGEHHFAIEEGGICGPGASAGGGNEICLRPADADSGRFSIEATIGIDFHWQQQEVQTFAGALRLRVTGGERLSVINEIPLETYLTSVVASEMSATSPVELIKAHSVVSRSWLLAQRRRAARGEPQPSSDAGLGSGSGGELIRWYDREGHSDFDVCADDHCQRYHGIGRVSSPAVHAAVAATRGRVLAFDGEICDARYAKACGGVTEDFRAAWSDEVVPYLVPVLDGPSDHIPVPSLEDEAALRQFIDDPPAVYCNCDDDTVLDQILTPHDRETLDFFRWSVKLTATEATEIIEAKLGAGLGRILALEPVQRGRSGRLVRLRLVGERGSLVVGKELEIRRALSPSHLYSSAFVVDAVGPPDRPDGFVLHGVGWGHGVGLCQIGAAVMAARGKGYEEILGHYYPGAALDRLYP